MSIELTDANFNQTITSNKVVVVDFWAPWCGPCRAIAPMIDQLSGEFNGKAVIGKLNVDSNPGTMEKFGIRNIPAILFFKNGTMVDKQVGAPQKSWITDKINSLL